VSAFVINPFAFFSGENWSPEQLGGLMAWFDINDAATISLNGTTVSQWRDKSAYGRHLIQLDLSKQATYSNSAFLGKPTLQFDGVDDTYRSAAIGSSIGGNSFTFMAVVNKGTVGSYYISLRSSPIGTRGYLRRTSTGVNAQWGDPLLSNTGLLMADGSYGLVGFNRGLDDGCSVYKDGSTTDIIYPTFPSPFSVFHLGSFNETLQFSNIWVSELVLTVPALPTVTRQQLEGYLAHKWNLQGNLPTGHPYKTTIP